MSSYIKKLKHPLTGKEQKALCIDDYFGQHRYGYFFLHNGKNATWKHFDNLQQGLVNGWDIFSEEELKGEIERPSNNISEIRQFESGATRSSNNGKIEYYGFRHPLTELSYGEYMIKHQTQENGEKRESNNWWKGWNKKISLQSLIRHTEDLQAIHAGYNVWKVYLKEGEKTIYLKEGEEVFLDSKVKYVRVSEEDCCNAIRFNAGAYLLEVLKNKQ